MWGEAWRHWPPWRNGRVLDGGEEILVGLFEAVPDAIVVVDHGGRIVRANAQADRMFGYAAGELCGHAVEVLVPERQRASHRDHRAFFVSDPSRRKMGEGRRLFGRRKDGIEFPVDISLTPIDGPTGSVIMAVVHDLSERREALRRFRRLLESAPDAMLLTGRSGHIVMINSRGERMFGYARRELVGVHVELLVPEPARTRHRAGFASFWEQPRVQHLGGTGPEIHGLRNDGSTFPVEIDVGPLETEVGLVAVASIRDLTERRQAEREREQLLEQLAQSRESLRALSGRLVGAQEAERRAIAHELHDEIGQALTAVTLDLQALQATKGSASHTLVESALDITRRVMAQIREMSLDLRPSLLDDLGLTAAIRWSLERHEQRLGWSTELRGNLGDARVSPDVETTCFRVVQEALTNVAKHARAHRVCVELKHRVRELVCEVRDDGRGFDVVEARARAIAGYSLGLLGMEERILALGGQFAIESSAAAGTVVRARLPVPR